MKILVTGFDPFGGEKINPAYEAVKLLPTEIAGAEIVKAEIPTVFGKCGEALEQAIEKHKPNAVMCVGQAGGRSVISIEKVAINWAESGIPDNEGQKPDGKVIIEDGATAYFSTLPIKAMAKKIKEYGIPSGISYTAGTFVCNDIMYRLLYMIGRKYPKIRGGFVHVPFALSQAVSKPDGTPGMPIDIIAKGLEYAVETICECEMDIAGI